MNMDPLFVLLVSLIPLLFMILILLTYLNVTETRRGRIIEDHISSIAESLKKLVEMSSSENK